jgi:hypothetical protein
MLNEGVPVTPEEVALGYIGSLVARAGFTSLPYELLGPLVDGAATPELEAMVRERLALTRFIIDLAAHFFLPPVQM